MTRNEAAGVPGRTEMPLGVASPALKIAIADAQAGDDHLYRWPNGVWRNHPWDAEAKPLDEVWHGAATIYRMLRDGHAHVVARMARGSTPRVIELAARHRRDPAAKEQS